MAYNISPSCISDLLRHSRQSTFSLWHIDWYHRFQLDHVYMHYQFHLSSSALKFSNQISSTVRPFKSKWNRIIESWYLRESQGSPVSQHSTLASDSC